jgi:hypothetical protein
MKKDVNSGILAVAAVVVVGIVGFIAWRMFGPEPPVRDTPEARAEAKRWVETIKRQHGAAPR